MSTAWAPSSHIRHPWFDTVMMKRKHRDTVSPDDEYPSSPVVASRATVSAKPTSPPPAKRRRCSLENGLAGLSLNALMPHATLLPSPTVTTTATTTTLITHDLPAAPLRPRGYYAESPSSGVSSTPSPDSYPYVQDVTDDGTMEAEPYFVGGLSSITQRPSPYTVEEPQIAEVDMKTSSWYEPERDRIVVTDIDSFAQSDDEGEDGANASAHHINPALLSRIRSTVARAPSLLHSNPSNSQALVLFKPVPIVGEELERIQEERARLAREAELAASQSMKVDEDDAMDVEP